MENNELEFYLQQLNIPLDEFTSQEKFVLNKIISQLERTGKSSVLDSLWLEDYEEKPVDMKRFIIDEEYIGNATDCGKAIWPSWTNTLIDIFSPQNKITLLLLSGAIGTGKSTIACTALSYIVYKLLCLKDPAKYYNIMPGSKPGIALFNITLTKSEGVAFHKLNTIFRSSPWFLRHGEEVGNTSNRKVFIPDKNVTIGIGSNADHFIGLDIFSCFMDEVSFKDNKELELSQMKAYDTFTNITRRMESRFMDEGQLPGMAIICSSTRDESDFLTQLKEREVGKPNVLLIERPLWKSVPKERYCGKTFKLIISTKSTEAFILRENQNIDDYKNTDYDIYDVPIEHYDSFNTDIYGAIRDILGRPLKTASRFLVQEKVENAVDSNFKNIFDQELIPLGLKDGSSIIQHINIQNINPKLIKYPIFVHHDLSLSGDKTGIFGYAVANDIRKDELTNQEETNSWMFIPVFWCRVMPDKQGQQIPLYKIRSAIIELRDKYGFNILGVSADGYQSADMLQQYQLHNFQTFLISMDRPPSNGYQFFRSSLYSGQIILPDSKFLLNELIRLVENRAVGKVDHTAGQSKDLSDSCAGAIYCAVEYNKKSKKRIFSDGGYLFSDIITGTNDKGNIEPIDLNKETDEILKEIGKGLFSDFDELNNDSDFNIY